MPLGFMETPEPQTLSPDPWTLQREQLPENPRTRLALLKLPGLVCSPADAICGTVSPCCPVLSCKYQITDCELNC